MISQVKTSNQDGFILYSDNTRQWIDHTCHTQLTNAGHQSELLRYNDDILPLNNTPGKHTCNEISALL